MDTFSPTTSKDSQTPISIGSLNSKDRNPVKEGKSEVSSVSSPGSTQPAKPVPQEITVRTVLNDQELMKIADELGEKWEPLSIHIGFKRSDIFRFKQDNSSVLMAIHAMLVEWRQRQYNQDDVKEVGKELSHALASCGRLDLSGIVDNMCSTKHH